MICPATHRVGATVYHCQRELGLMHGGHPCPHLHHEWERKIGSATLTLSWDAVIDVEDAR